MEVLVHVGFTNAVLAAALALVAAGAERIGRCPVLAYALWLLVLLKLLTPPLLPVRIPWPHPDTTVLPEPVALDAQPRCGADAGVFSEASLAPAHGDMASISAGETVAGSAASEPVHGLAQDALPRVSWEVAVGVCWLAGSLAWSALAALRIWRFGRLLGSAEPAPRPVHELARRLAERLGLRRCPGVWLLPGSVSPMLWAGAGVPRVLLPSMLWGRLTEEQRATLLAHELAHLRRRDHWVRRLELLALALYWWHPAAWWAVRRLQEAGEECCDACVVGALPALAEAYAEALVETVAFLSGVRPALPAGASGAGPAYRLRRRLLMILNGSTPRSLSRAGWWAVLALGAVGLPLWPTTAPGQPPPREARREEPAREARREEPARTAADPTRAELQEENVRLRKELEAMHDRIREIERTLRRFEATEHRSTQPLPPLPSAAPATPAAPRPPRILAPPDPALPAATDRPGAVRFGRVPAAGQPPARGAGGSEGISSLRSASGGGYDQRMRALEEKLDRVLEELKSLRQQRPDRPEGSRH